MLDGSRSFDRSGAAQAITRRRLVEHALLLKSSLARPPDFFSKPTKRRRSAQTITPFSNDTRGALATYVFPQADISTFARVSPIHRTTFSTPALTSGASTNDTASYCRSAISVRVIGTFAKAPAPISLAE
jgi:hypothetical protein